MILLDASVVIPFTKGKEPKLNRLLKTLPTAICGLTRAEVLHGVRNPAERAYLIVVLNGFTPVATSETIWDGVGDNLATLRRNGISSQLTDVVLATLAIACGFEVWARDTDFALMQPHLPALRLFVEPP